MALITVPNLKLFTDKIAVAYGEAKKTLGIASGGIVAGTTRDFFNKVLSVIANDFGDVDPQVALGGFASSYAAAANSQSLFSGIKKLLSALETHIQVKGPAVDPSIVSLNTFLKYYNGGSGGALFSSMLHYDYYNIVLDELNITLPPAGIFSPGIHPSIDPISYPNGYGTCTFGNVFTAGAAVNAAFTPGLPFLETIVNVANDSSQPSFTVTGTDDLGATGQTWTATLANLHQTAALSTTLGANVTAGTKLSVLVGNSTGFTVGNTVVVGAGTVTQETCVVLAIADGTHLTLEFRKAHSSGDTVTGFALVALTPNVAGRRIASVSNIVGVWHTANAGTVRVVSAQERMGDPS